MSFLRRAKSTIGAARRHRAAALFAGANLGLQLVGLVCQLLVLRWIPPEQLGIWALALTIDSYLVLTQLGIVNAFNREFPFLMSLERTDEANRVAATAQAYALVNGLFLLIVFLCIGAVWSVMGWVGGIVFAAYGITALLTQCSSYLEATFRAGRDFETLSWLRLAQSPVLLLTLVLPWKFGLVGFAERAVIAALIALLLLFVARPLRVRPALRRKPLRLLFSTGWRLCVWRYSNAASQAFPRLALTAFGGTLLLGLYSPVIWVFTAFSGLAQSFNSYLYPQLTHRFAKGDVSVGRTAAKLGLLIAVMVSPFALAGMFAVPWLLSHFAPNYSPAVNAMRIALVAASVDCVSIVAVAFHVAKAWRRMYLFLAGAAAVRAIGAFGISLLFADKLAGVAAGQLFASVCIAILALVLTASLRGSAGAKPVSGDDNEPLPVDANGLPQPT